MIKKGLLFILLSTLVVSCKVGPDYRSPRIVMPCHYSEETPILKEENIATWWKNFNDPFLNELIQETLSGSFDLRLAMEKVCQSRSEYWTNFTSLFPEIEYAGSSTRSRLSQSVIGSRLLGPVYQDFYLAGFDAVWELDFFGKFRRGVAAAYATWQALDENVRNVKIMVVSEVAKTYTLIRFYQNQLSIAQDIVLLDVELLNQAKELQKSGLSNQQAVENAIAKLESDSSSVIIFKTLFKQSIYSLGILLGRAPETLVCSFNSLKNIPSAFGLIPAGLPSDLLRRRPDIRAAERNLAAATEQIGIAVAAQFPAIALTGSTSSYSANPIQGANIGFASNTLRDLFDPKSLLWGAGGLITGPLIDFGKRSAAVDAQISLRKQAFIFYQQTIIKALQEVEISLVAYFNEEKKLKALEREEAANRKSLELIKDLFDAGLTAHTEVLTSQEKLLNSINTRLRSQSDLAISLITIYKSMGGDWGCSYSP
ncbi:MAG: TolC family protein [Chlamydiae bacterium]|nr:TolC family protein [Chlamydiota bacterium]